MKKTLLFFVLLCSCAQSPAEAPNVLLQDSDGPVISFLPQDVTSQSLGVVFQLPPSLEYCETEEFDLSKESTAIEDPNYIPQGSRLSIRCGDFYLDAVTPDFTPYEGMWPHSTFPSTETLMKSLSEGRYEHYSYGSEGSNSGIFVMDTFWNSDPGPTYWIGTYIPLPSDSIYKTARFGLRLDPFPDFSDPNYQAKVDDYLQSLISKTAAPSSLEKLQDFEAILDSIKDLDDYHILP